MPEIDIDDAQLESLPDEIKFLALQARTGSVLPLQVYCQSNKLDLQTTCQIASLALAILNPDELPSLLDTSPPGEPSDRHMASLRLLSQLSGSLREDDHDLAILSNLFLQKQSRLFPWLTFSCTYSLCRVSGPDSAPSLHALLLISSLASIIKTLAHATNQFDARIHGSFVELVSKLWTELLFIDWDNLLPTTLFHDVERFVWYFLKEGTVAPAEEIILKLGDSHAMVGLYLAHMEHYFLRMATCPPEHKDIKFVSTLAENAVQHLLTLLQADDYHCDPVQIQSGFQRITHVVMQLFDRRASFLPAQKAHRDFHASVNSASSSYCRLIVGLPMSSTLSAPAQMLKAGATTKLRRMAFATRPTADQLAQLRSFTDHLYLHSAYPAIFKRSKGLIHMPSYQSAVSHWSHFDEGLVLIYEDVWNKMGAKAKRLNKCATCSRRGNDYPLQVCSGCRVTRHCSKECQQVDWQRGHRVSCKLFQYSKTDFHLINTNNCKGLLYLAQLENVARRHQGLIEKVNTLLAAKDQPSPFPPDEIPLIYFPLLAESRVSHVKRFGDFPELFSDPIWKTELVPMFKKMISMGRMQKFLTVVELPLGSAGKLNIFSPMTSAIVAGLAPLKEWEEMVRMVRPLPTPHMSEEDLKTQKRMNEMYNRMYDYWKS